MIAKKGNSISTAIALFILPAIWHVAWAEECENIYFREGATPAIYTSVDLGTSIEFPQAYSHYLANNPEVLARRRCRHRHAGQRDHHLPEGEY